MKIVVAKDLFAQQLALKWFVASNDHYNSYYFNILQQLSVDNCRKALYIRIPSTKLSVCCCYDRYDLIFPIATTIYVHKSALFGSISPKLVHLLSYFKHQCIALRNCIKQNFCSRLQSTLMKSVKMVAKDQYCLATINISVSFS